MALERACKLRQGDVLVELIDGHGLRAIDIARAKKAKILSICNVIDSSIPRKSNGVLYTHAGPEISVASTKAFTTQLTALYLLAVALGYFYVTRPLLSEEPEPKLLAQAV